MIAAAQNWQEYNGNRTLRHDVMGGHLNGIEELEDIAHRVFVAMQTVKGRIKRESSSVLNKGLDSASSKEEEGKAKNRRG